MPSVYDSDNFAGRVNYAAAVITRGGNTSRSFDTCFEMWDGDEVAAALVRRAQSNPRLAANLFRYICRESATAAYERLKHLSPRELAAHARQKRDREQARNVAWAAAGYPPYSPWLEQYEASLKATA